MGQTTVCLQSQEAARTASFDFVIEAFRDIKAVSGGNLPS